MPSVQTGHLSLQVHYGSHPRHLVLTDPTVCSLYDVRAGQSSLDLFEVPSNRLLQMDERIVTATKSADFTHHILSHHSLITVDERFVK